MPAVYGTVSSVQFAVYAVVRSVQCPVCSVRYSVKCTVCIHIVGCSLNQFRVDTIMIVGGEKAGAG